MKKTGVLNSEISKIIAEMGHMDMLAVVDLGFPIPQEVKKVDLVVDKGKPSVLEVIEVILRELKVEKLILAEEINKGNFHFKERLIELIERKHGTIEVVFIPHEEFKRMTKNVKGIIRTGSDIPYSNVILVSGVIF